MKTLLKYTCIMLISGLYSCNNEDAFFESLNENPTIKIGSSPNSVVYDSVKISLKTGQSSYVVNLTYADVNNNIQSLAYNVQQGKGAFYSDPSFQKQIIAPAAPNTNGRTTIYFKPDFLGLNVLQFKSTDKFDKNNTATLNLTAFQNITPVANFVYTNTKFNSPYEYSFDASKSYDRDQKYGGAILTYKWTINDVSKQTDKPIFPWVFSGPGSYRLTLEVLDNDAQYGISATTTVVVN